MNSSGTFTTVVTNAGNNITVAAPAVTPGTLFSAFVLDPMEAQACISDKGAFEDIGVARMFGSSEGLRKSMAACLYGRGYHEIGQVQKDAQAGDTVINLSPDAIIKLDIGSNLTITSTTTLNATDISATANVVSAIDTGTGDVTISALAADVPAGAWVKIAGGLDTSGNTRVPIGLGGWLPTIGGRSGADWNTYIGTSFFGLTRSAHVARYAGGYFARSSVAGYNYADAIIAGLKLQRRQGGLADRIVVNDDDYMQVLQDSASKLSYFNYTKGSGSSDNQTYTYGADALKFAFSKSWTDKVIDSPYCPQKTAYCIDMKGFKFVALSKMGKMFSAGPKNNQPGAPEVKESKGTPTNYQMMIDEWISTQPCNTANGQGVLVSLNVFGNFAFDAPGHNVVINLA